MNDRNNTSGTSLSRKNLCLGTCVFRKSPLCRKTDILGNREIKVPLFASVIPTVKDETVFDRIGGFFSFFAKAYKLIYRFGTVIAIVAYLCSGRTVKEINTLCVNN